MRNKKPLTQKTLDAIPIISHQSPLRDLDEKIAEFEQIRKDKRNELANTSYAAGFGHATTKSDALKDGEFLADGGQIDTLAGAHSEDRRRDVLRQIAALEKAIAICENRRRHALKKAIAEACKNLPPAVLEVFHDVIKAAEALVSAIELAIEVDNVLNKKGLESRRRDQRFEIIPYWRNLLFSGPGANLPALRVILEGQRRIWDTKK